MPLPPLPPKNGKFNENVSYGLLVGKFYEKVSLGLRGVKLKQTKIWQLCMGECSMSPPPLSPKNIKFYDNVPLGLWGSKQSKQKYGDCVRREGGGIMCGGRGGGK